MILRKHIPKQSEIDTMLKLIKKRVLRDYNLSITAREIKKEQQLCPHFGDTYAWIVNSVLPGDKKTAKRVIQAEDYVALDGVLFKMSMQDKRRISGDDWSVRLVKPDKLAPEIISLYHDSITCS